MAEAEYKRLTNWRIRWTSTTIVLAFLFPISLAFATRCKLWFGENHLLCVDANGYAETYKRFYFRDIQAVTVQQTYRGRAWNFILGAFAAIVLIVTLMTKPPGSPATWSGGDLAGGIIMGTLAFIVVVLLLYNIFSGPTCKTQIHTAVQVEDLPPLRRIRRTHKVLEKIRPLIAGAQGQLTAGDISARMSELISLGSSQPDNAPPVIS